MILTDFNVGEQAPWLGKAVDALVETWRAQPLGRQWTIGIFVVIAVFSKPLFEGLKLLMEGLAAVVAAFRKGK